MRESAGHTQKDVPATGRKSVCAGFVVTHLTASLPQTVKDQITAATPLGRFASANEVAAAVTFRASDEAAYITGQVLGVVGGLATE